MALESAGFISALVSTNPTSSDGLSQGDDHIRLLKATLLATFPNFSAVALGSTQAQIDAAVAFVALTVSEMGDGTNAAPSFAFTSETGTGWYKKSAGVAALSIAGTDTFEFSATGLNVLVGGLSLAGTNIFPLQSGNIGAAQVLTAAVANANITYAKIQNVTDARLLGNFSGAAAAPSEYSLGAGLTQNSGVLSAPAFPPAGVFKNLVIKVLTNTTVKVAADYVTTTDGTNFRTTAVNTTVNFATNGGVAALEGSLSVAASTQYRLWVITKPDGTTSVLANTSDTTITTWPSGYTASARVGQVFTNASSLLMGTWQFGRRVRYIVGLAGTTTSALISNAIVGAYDRVSPTLASVSVVGVVPSTASVIFVTLGMDYKNGTAASILVAPSAAYSGTNNGPLGTAGNVFPLWSEGYLMSHNAAIFLESTSLYVANNNLGGGLICDGWEDNI